MITVGGCVTAFWFVLATAPVGFCVPVYVVLPDVDLMVMEPLLDCFPASQVHWGPTAKAMAGTSTTLNSSAALMLASGHRIGK